MMESKSAPWGGSPGRAPNTATVEFQIGNDCVCRFHRDEEGRVWMRFFEWRNVPPGYWVASRPIEHAPPFTKLLLEALDSAP